MVLFYTLCKPNRRLINSKAIWFIHRRVLHRIRLRYLSALWSRMTSNPTIYFGDLRPPNHEVNAISKLNRVRHRNRPASSIPVICSIPKLLPSTVNSVYLFIQFLANPSKQLDDTPPPLLTDHLSPASRRDLPHHRFPNVLVPKNHQPTLQITRQLPHHR